MTSHYPDVSQNVGIAKHQLFSQALDFPINPEKHRDNYMCSTFHHIWNYLNPCNNKKKKMKAWSWNKNIDQNSNVLTFPVIHFIYVSKTKIIIITWVWICELAYLCPLHPRLLLSQHHLLLHNTTWKITFIKGLKAIIINITLWDLHE